jgi:hypothetical protein
MTRNSTLLFILDGSEGEKQCINIDEMLDPYGKSSKELNETFKGVDISPRKELIDKILMNA